jgi:phage shock protein C
MQAQLTRDTRHATLGGVAAGWARYLGVDPTLVRLAFVLLALAHGFGILAYVICWIVMPPEGRGEAAAVPPTPHDELIDGLRSTADQAAAMVQEMQERLGSVRLLVGGGLMLLGTFLLLHNLGWLYWPRWIAFSTLWPLLLVALGGGLVWRALDRRAS